MKTYTNTTFTGYYPVGAAAIVRALSRELAADALNAVLQSQVLAGDAKAEDMELWPHRTETVRILVDGNY